ncbi:MAG: carboxypeptidase, partial [Lactobacillus crispatus]|nr:carboxypeptidase [Lactobacillus crispatus]
MNNDQPRRGGFKDAWHRFDSRFFIGRWIILILLTLMLLTCTYYTIKVKTSNIANLKASLSTTTTIYDYKGKKAGSLYSQKGSFVEYDQIS